MASFDEFIKEYVRIGQKDIRLLPRRVEVVVGLCVTYGVLSLYSALLLVFENYLWLL